MIFNLNKYLYIKSKQNRIFHVNWFRKSNDGEGSFIWPGFGENIRVLEWIFKRVDEPSNSEKLAIKTPIGYMPTKESFDLNGLNINQETFTELFKLDKQFLLDEVDEIKNYLDENVNDSAPNEIYKQLNDYKTRILNEM